MPKWTRPEEGLPQVWVGDRVAVIVAERPYAGAALRPYLIMLTATEDGWKPDDPHYHGYTPEDGVFWSTEDSVCAFVRALSPERFV